MKISKLILMVIYALTIAPWAQSIQWFKLEGEKKARLTQVAEGPTRLAFLFSNGNLRTCLNPCDSLQLVSAPKGTPSSLTWINDTLFAKVQGSLVAKDMSASNSSWVTIEAKLEGTASSFLLPDGNDFWIGGQEKLQKIVRGAKSKTPWSMALPKGSGTVQQMIRLGGELYIATSGGGLLILDPNTKTIRQFRTGQGLPANEILGISLMEKQLFLATAGGMAVYNLETRKCALLGQSFPILSFAQASGEIMVQTMEGPAWVDPKSGISTPINAELEGILEFGLGQIWGASLDGKILRGARTGVFRVARPIISAVGSLDFSVQNMPKSANVSANLWYPEAPGTSIPLSPKFNSATGIVQINLPEDAVGEFMVDLAVKSNSTTHTATFPVSRELTQGQIELENIPEFTNKTSLTIQGKVLGAVAPSLHLLPTNQSIAIRKNGTFSSTLALKEGWNNFSMESDAPSGQKKSFPIRILLDRTKPAITGPTEYNTKDESLSLEFGVLEEFLSEVRMEPKDKAEAILNGSTILVNARELPFGKSKLSLIVEDKSGNSTRHAIEVFRVKEQAQEPRVESTQPDCPGSSGRTEIAYKVRKGETLGKIAKRFYGHMGMWKELAKYNNISTSHSGRVHPRQVIRIPLWPEMRFGKFQKFPPGL
jgi:hypothetical protein